MNYKRLIMLSILQILVRERTLVPSGHRRDCGKGLSDLHA
ncbi:hypothetical protein F542_10060 [Bibersteinia trehalosi USDA-ARS-USMARC-188]|uniref:Uncharacterized protein n=1 Tax=Bibersteinia trehalosi USDA-ARS-USMARC-188 TaxID=1263829 RepID=A0A4V7I9L0_BIBTR|nr:hypothetical protein F542_10060 [Bibersteinia trehalosi USDA-ARS-USMARC-188]